MKRLSRPAILITGLLLLAPGGARGAQDERLDEARTAVEQWVEMQRLISKEKRDWELGRELLVDQIELVERQIEELRAEIETAEKGIEEAEAKQADVKAEIAKYEEGFDALRRRLAPLEVRTKELVARLPEPAAEQVILMSQRLPEDPATDERGIPGRYMAIVGVLNGLNRFHREIHVASELRELEDGSTAEVSTFYVGLGQAFYANTDGTAGGTGVPGAEGWVWSPANVAAAEIHRAVGMLEGPETAAYVNLPVRID